MDTALKTLRHPVELLLSGKKLAVRERKVGGGRRNKRPKKKKQLASAAAMEEGEGEGMEVEPSEDVPLKIGGVKFSKDAVESLRAAKSVSTTLRSIIIYFPLYCM